jgi:hypothetical protein|tara:strand:+ start:220 stop:753 length:534 start_codon:yes stop_codon:yes gene_type:complete
MRFTKRITCLVLILLLGGCQYMQVQSSQLSSVKDMVFPEAEDAVIPRWELQLGGYIADLQPVTVGKNTVFVSKKSDTITFDGWKITQVKGLNSFLPAWEIQDIGRERRFLVRGDLIATHYCEEWVRLQIATGIRFEQACRASQPYTNILLVDSLGMITSIVQVVDSSLMPVQLRFKH